MKILRLLTAALTALLLTGCSAAWEKGEVVVVQENQVTIHILAGQSTSDAGSEDMIERTLREKFPGVDFQWTCVDWGNGFAPQMTSRFAAGKMPDILIGKAQDVTVYQKLGAILPLQEQAVVNVDADALELVTVDERIYGLPYNVLYQGVLYNKAIFRELGLSVPETRQELHQVVDRCEAAGYTAFGLHYGDVWSIGNLNMQFWMNDLFAEYPTWGEMALSGETGFSQEPLVADAFRQCRYMLEHSYVDALQIDQAECNKRFAQGETAMFMTGTWSLQTLSQLNPGLELGLFPYPNSIGSARLLEEVNLTIMKGNTGKDQELVDAILLELGTNLQLAGEIAEFTSANSTFDVLRSTDNTVIDQLSKPYVADGNVVDVSLGNNQFIWPFQNDVAAQALKWMENKMTLEALLDDADAAFRMR